MSKTYNPFTYRSVAEEHGLDWDKMSERAKRIFRRHTKSALKMFKQDYSRPVISNEGLRRAEERMDQAAEAAVNAVRDVQFEEGAF